MSSAERYIPQPTSPTIYSEAPNEETPLLASIPRLSHSQASWLWPSFLSRHLPTTKDLDANSAVGASNSLEQNEPRVHTDEASANKADIVGSIVVLYFGVWLASIDVTMVTAIYNTISSDFGGFQDAMWVIAAYHLGIAPAQPLYGKLSDIFGHKAMLTIAYVSFGIGCVLCGLGSSLFQFTGGRVVAGVGGAGMRSLVSSLIVHLVPLRDVAVWRSWMYVMATFGRSVGAPLGGILADSVGWRASFISQAPLALLALALVWWKLPTDFEHTAAERDSNASKNVNHTTLSKLRRIDFPGAFLIATSIVAFLLVLNFASKRLTLSDPLIIGLILLWMISSLLFLLVEAKYAPEPIFPLRLLLERDVLTAYLIIGLLLAGSMSMFSSVALYFRVTERASNTIASVHLLPSVVGNTIGSLLAGWVIKRTGRYRPLTILAPFSSATCFLLLYIRWKTQPLALIESFYISLSGFGNGVSMAAVFVFLTAGTRKEDAAIASGAFYLANSLGEVTGMAVQNCVLLGTLGSVLRVRLRDVEGCDEIIGQVTASVSNIWLFPSDIQSIIVDTYVQGLGYTYLFSLGCALLALALSFTVREHSLAPR